MLLTPAKWASKKVIHHLLLSFPGGETSPTVACVYCPEMCRFSCPTAVITGNDAVTPCNKMSQLYAHDHWNGGKSAEGSLLGESASLWPIYDCTGCGRCTEYCVHQVPVGERLLEARGRYSFAPALVAAQQLDASEDPVGDLAWELGAQDLARERWDTWVNSLQSHPDSDALCTQNWMREPKSVHFVRARVESQLASGESPLQGDVLLEVPWSAELALLNLRARGREAWQGGALGRYERWRVWDSPWASRHLGAVQVMEQWLTLGSVAGKQWVSMPQSLYPPSATADVEDAGLEGAYGMLFPEQARKLLLEVWNRIPPDAYDGVWVWSPRAKQKLERAMRDQILPTRPVMGWWEVAGA